MWVSNQHYFSHTVHKKVKVASTTFRLFLPPPITIMTCTEKKDLTWKSLETVKLRIKKNNGKYANRLNTKQWDHKEVQCRENGFWNRKWNSQVNSVVNRRIAKITSDKSPLSTRSLLWIHKILYDSLFQMHKREIGRIVYIKEEMEDLNVELQTNSCISCDMLLSAHFYNWTHNCFQVSNFFFRLNLLAVTKYSEQQHICFVYITRYK